MVLKFYDHQRDASRWVGVRWLHEYEGFGFIEVAHSILKPTKYFYLELFKKILERIRVRVRQTLRGGFPMGPWTRDYRHNPRRTHRLGDR